MKRILVEVTGDGEGNVTPEDLALVNELRSYAKWWATDPTGASRFDSDVEVWVNGLIYRHGVMVGNYDERSHEPTYYESAYYESAVSTSQF